MEIEEKAKAYDELFVKAKQIYSKENDVLILHTIEDLFPELKESEGERIRKEMIFYFQEEIPQCSIQEHSDKMREFISWLKRQEIECIKLELKAGNSYFCYKSRWERADNETFKKGLIYKCNKDGVLDNFVIKNPEQHFIEIKDERIAWLEKQGEKIDAIENFDTEFEKQVSCLIASVLSNEYEYTESFVKWVSNSLLGYAKHEIEKQGEQNTAWSEEDESIRKAIVEGLKAMQSSFHFISSVKLDSAIDWLKSLRP